MAVSDLDLLTYTRAELRSYLYDLGRCAALISTFRCLFSLGRTRVVILLVCYVLWAVWRLNRSTCLPSHAWLCCVCSGRPKGRLVV